VQQSQIPNDQKGYTAFISLQGLSQKMAIPGEEINH
jgi:hypothetical protein